MNGEVVMIKKMLPEIVIAQCEIYIQPTMAFVIRVFAWLLPNNYQLYLQYDKSMNNIFISHLITLLSDHSLFSGVNVLGSDIAPHVIHVFNIVDKSPTQQICHILAH